MPCQKPQVFHKLVIRCLVIRTKSLQRTEDYLTPLPCPAALLLVDVVGSIVAIYIFSDTILVQTAAICRS